MDVIFIYFGILFLFPTDIVFILFPFTLILCLGYRCWFVGGPFIFFMVLLNKSNLLLYLLSSFENWFLDCDMFILLINHAYYWSIILQAASNYLKKNTNFQLISILKTVEKQNIKMTQKLLDLLIWFQLNQTPQSSYRAKNQIILLVLWSFNKRKWTFSF